MGDKPNAANITKALALLGGGSKKDGGGGMMKGLENVFKNRCRIWHSNSFKW
jgi:glycerate kinase